MARLNTVMELHVEVFQGLQKIDSFQQDMFEFSEVDLHLNKQQDRFINELFSTEFEDHQLRLDYVRDLIVKNHPLPVAVPVSGEPLYEPNTVFAVLPPDYMYLVNDRSKILTSATYCTDILSKLQLTEDTEYLSVLSFPVSSRDAAPYYNGFNIIVTENGVSKEIYTLPDSYTGYLSDVNARYMIINHSLEYMNRSLNPTTRIYWERYRGKYYPGSYIFVRDDNAWTQMIATALNDETENPTVDEQTTAVLSSKTYQRPGIDPEEVKDAVERYIDNGMTEGDKLYDLNKNVYYRTSQGEPTSAMAQDLIFAYHDKSFLITEVMIDYVRKPRQISLLLDQSCEISSSAGRADIVDKTVQYMKLLIENPAYREFLQDNIIKNQNTLTHG